VFLIERHVSDLTGEPVSAVAALGVASPKPDQASPADLAGYVREQWSVGALHLAGRHDTTEATRWASRYMDRPFTIRGLTS
jgi:hypothetical protein